MPITEANPFKGRQYPGQVIVTAVRWDLRYPLGYEHVSEVLSERGLPVDASWVPAFLPQGSLTPSKCLFCATDNVCGGILSNADTQPTE